MNVDPQLQRALDACAEEPIHVIGAIQPPGVLLVFRRSDHRIVAASANAVELFEVDGINALLGQPVETLLDSGPLGAIEAVLARGVGGLSQFAGIINVGPMGAMHEVSTHAMGDLVHLELQPAGQAPPLEGGHMAVSGLDDASAGQEFLPAVARKVQALSGYGRVMVYRFLADHSGEVVAEALAGDMASYADLRFPASDIPPQARALYVRNRLRVIADTSCTPVPVHQLPSLGAPLDMSFDVLRAVAPVHVEYLHNMGVAASMSISLVVNGKLWGLVACHHDAPRPIGARQRQALDMVGRHVSMILDARALRARARREDVMRAQRDALESTLRAAPVPSEALLEHLDVLQGAVRADGVAVHIGGELRSHGVVPDAAGLDAALQWARAQGRRGPASTRACSDWTSAGMTGACGLFSTPLGEGADDWLLLFRSEQRETVRWAGRPDRPFQVDPDGGKIGPRTSFEAWEQQVVGTAAPWTDRDAELAHHLCLVIERHLVAAPSLPRPAEALMDERLVSHEARDLAARLLRLAELLSTARTRRARLQRLNALLLQMEEELGALADVEE
ncbi:GAF domain-containing protein [Luteimonas sp. MC1572]|uniref:GAF domain-containing protein n=1 Tax=Luteimonas sp. MC1572 TaxID=2799325 RepID=UPI0018F0B130|nr:GAF domain-containing protein [Luteimonas sp. MC1572]MBJ6980923.1 GAF domain-containing protein [Luteimonas sp. MC1572]QQO02279.1 GAF domain-containing protein [Luteimonas sp. MC1572]